MIRKILEGVFSWPALVVAGVEAGALAVPVSRLVGLQKQDTKCNKLTNGLQTFNPTLRASLAVTRQGLHADKHGKAWR